jgi:hypothetical protein
MTRRSGLAISILLGLAAATGAVAVIKSANVARASAAKPVAPATLHERQRALDSFAASLTKALSRKPPRLPRVPNYPTVKMPVPPAQAGPAPTQARPAEQLTSSPGARERSAKSAPPTVRPRPQNAASGSSSTAQPPAIVAPKLVKYAAMAVGNALAGQTLVGYAGGWTGTAPLSTSYQWQLCDTSGSTCVDIAGATDSTLLLTNAEIGHTVRVVATVSNAAGKGSATSAVTAVVSAPATTAAPASGSTASGSGDQSEPSDNSGGSHDD